MKSLRFLTTIIVISVATVAFAGDIQIFCEPGLKIYLDGQFMGTSNAKQDGLFLLDVRRGTRTIRVEKEGFVPSTLEVEVSDFPIEVRIGRLVPNPAAKLEAKATPIPVKKPVGNLVITSAPQNCTVQIDGRTETKDTPQLSIDGLDAGDHTISFSKPGYETLSGVVKIPAGAEVTVRGNLFDGKIETVHEGRGSLKIYSKPKRSTIHFRGKREEKIRDPHNITLIPAGEYPLIVEIRGRKLTKMVLIRDETTTVLEVSFVKGDEPISVSYVPH
jgi:hypothetical protein